MKKLYRSYEDSTKIFKEFEKKFPNNFRLESIGKTWEERDIYLITISTDIKNADKKPALFYTGTIHAREWIGHELAVEFASHALSTIELNPTLETYLLDATVYIVPCVNPDGFVYSQNHFSFWRKNRRVNADGTYGVDLNRNFSVGHIKSNITTSNVYGGPDSFSEPETKALKEFVENHKNITIALDYHSQGNVFFPAHDFRHEDTIDTTDLNILCANMADKIKQISNREYGIHQGKPPASLIGGSGREFYYSKGILSSVVEVGTRNISDYLDDMSEHIREHVSALIEAVKEVPNYSKDNELKRIEDFEVEKIETNKVKLTWKSKVNDDIFFEIYRSKKDKKYCKEKNIIGRTQALEYEDINLESNTNYYYNIRAINKKKRLKSPFPPQIKIRTAVEPDEFSRTYYANASKTGYVAENLKNNSKHFGLNSLFVGIDENKGISYAVITIDLKTIPKNAIIKYSSLNLYPINRVSTTIEKFGEWNISIIDPESVEDLTDFEQVHNAKILTYIGKPTKSDQLTQGIWRSWELSGIESLVLTEQLKHSKVIFRVEGPKDLKTGRKSQMMQWDIGYGKFGFGLNYRPRLELTYTIEPSVLALYSKNIYTITKNELLDNELITGFDKNGEKIYSGFEFNLSSLSSYEKTIITKAYVELNSTKTYLKDDIRFHLEFVDNKVRKEFKNFSNREVIQNIGYDVSANDLRNNQTQYFVFDSFSRNELNEKLKEKDTVTFILKPTSSNRTAKDKKITWEKKNSSLAPKLIIEYIDKRRFPLPQVTNAKYEIENNKIKVTWTNPEDEDFVGVKVIKNPFRKPLSSHDGQKIYAGKDNYTYDEFGALDIDKYIAIFTYDDVPNYSKPIIVEYKAK